MWHFILHITGADDVSGKWYGFWSGFGSDITEFGVIAVLWRKFNCHQSNCWRVGLHHGSEPGVLLCKRHFKRSEA